MKIFKFFMVLAVCLSPLFASAQDVITLKSGDEIQAKVTEVGQTEVKYKRFDNPDGPTYTVNKSDIFMVKYQNGQKDVFKDEQPAQNNKGNDDDGEFWKPYKWTNQRIAGVSLFADLGGFCFMGSRYGVELRYRRWQVNGFFKYGKIGLMNNVYWGLPKSFPDQNPTFNSAYGGGVTVKFLFPLGKTKSTLHVGVLNEWMDIDYSYSVYNYSYVYNRETYKIRNGSGSSSATGLGFGYSYNTNIGFYFTVGFYLGAVVYNGYYSYRDFDGKFGYNESGPSNWVDFYGTADVTIGWEFCVLRKK